VRPTPAERATLVVVRRKRPDIRKRRNHAWSAIPVPAGTEVELNGASKGTVEGKEFADALLACWLGPKPPSEDFKAGLLGN
jgi:hypothetical protein